MTLSRRPSRPVPPTSPNPDDGAPPSRAERFEALHAINVDDLAGAFKLDRVPGARRVLSRLVRTPSYRFVREAQLLDDLIGTDGLGVAGRRLLAAFSASATITGAERVPPSGPLLVVANHPGVADTLAVWAALDARDDLRVVALDRPFFRQLPRLQERVLTVPEHTGGRISMIRAAADHLRRGGALLTFPAGSIEPDPALRPDAAGSLRRWSDSTALLLRLAPRTPVLPVAVAGVLSPTALRHRAARLLRDVEDRERAAAALQVMLPRLRDNHARVLIGAPVEAEELAALRTAAQVNERIAAAMTPLLDSLRADAAGPIP